MVADTKGRIRTKEWHEGYNARRAGRPNSANPYASSVGMNAQRVHWFDGWYDAMHQEKWPDWLEM